MDKEFRGESTGKKIVNEEHDDDDGDRRGKATKEENLFLIATTKIIVAPSIPSSTMEVVEVNNLSEAIKEKFGLPTAVCLLFGGLGNEATILTYPGVWLGTQLVTATFIASFTLAKTHVAEFKNDAGANSIKILQFPHSAMCEGNIAEWVLWLPYINNQLLWLLNFDILYQEYQKQDHKRLQFQLLILTLRAR